MIRNVGHFQAENKLMVNLNRRKFRQNQKILKRQYFFIDIVILEKKLYYTYQ